MSLERLEAARYGACPVCAATVAPRVPVEETEILACPECQSRLVVDGFEGPRLVLNEAPRIEEDWGE